MQINCLSCVLLREKEFKANPSVPAPISVFRDEEAGAFLLNRLSLGEISALKQ